VQSGREWKFKYKKALIALIIRVIVANNLTQKNNKKYCYYRGVMMGIILVVGVLVLLIGINIRLYMNHHKRDKNK